MSRQREVLPAAIERLTAADPDFGLAVIGSVQHGYERPDSDVDLIAVVREGAEFDGREWTVKWENRGARCIEAPIRGVTVQVFFAPCSGLDRWIRETPHFMYPFSDSEVLRDPRGVAQGFRNTARRYFGDHPAVADAWRAQLRAHKRVKLEGLDGDGMYRTEDGRLEKYLTLDAFCSRIADMARANETVRA